MARESISNNSGTSVSVKTNNSVLWLCLSLYALDCQPPNLGSWGWGSRESMALTPEQMITPGQAHKNTAASSFINSWGVTVIPSACVPSTPSNVFRVTILDWMSLFTSPIFRLSDTLQFGPQAEVASGFIRRQPPHSPWVLTSWRSSYNCLLNRNELMPGTAKLVNKS